MQARGVRDGQPSPAALAASRSEVEELRERVARLERESLTDPVTGAWNRRFVHRILGNEVRRGRRHRLPLSVAVVAIDRVDAANEGGAAEPDDAALRVLYALLGRLLRASDLVARWAEREFLVMLPSTSHRNAAVVAERLRAAVAMHRFSGPERFTVSIGAAELLYEEEAEGLLDRAGSALYLARHGGGDRVALDDRGASEAWAREDAGAIVKLEWNESCASGHPALDAGYRGLFARANGLIAASLLPASRRDELMAAMARCFDHLRQQFGAEERLLAERGYAGLEAHKVAHRVLLQRAATLGEEIRSGEETFGAVVEFLAHEVVSRHLLTVDREFFPAVG